MSINIIKGNAYQQKLLKDTQLLGYSRNRILKKSFHEIGQEFQLTLKTKKPERVHGDSKSKFSGEHCMSVGFERAPVVEGGGYYTVFGLYEGDEVFKENLIMKAEFGDKIAEPKDHVVTGLMVRTVFLLMLKRSKFRGLDDIDEDTLAIDPEAK
ncbi:hypothetical protein C0989_002290 [Termitomyces sp. Mn162]|nr:hypothetical protein C0989_002290 [Termitomyces sp. Mn162]